MVRMRLTPHNLRRGSVFLLKFLLVLVYALGFAVVFIYFTPTKYNLGGNGNIMAGFFYAFLFSMLAIPYDVFKIGILRLRELRLSLMLTIFLTDLTAYLVLCLITRLIINPGPMLILMLLQMIFGYFYMGFANGVYFKLYPSRETVIVYSNSEWDKDVAKKFAALDERYTIRAVCKEEDGYDAIVAEIEKYNTCILGQINSDLRHRLLMYCYEQRKRLFVMPSVDDIIMQSSHVTQIGDSLVYLVKDRTISLEQLIVKRSFDILFSALCLLILSPVLLIVAAIIKATDGGPVFFKQTRYTRNMEPFEIIKFRSMVIDAEKNGAQLTTDNDERITPIGRFLRKSRLDEVPQFFNVLKGEMSVVGPRAERVENYEEYCKVMPEFAYRTRVKAGITGYAQIYGKYNTSFEDKARMDIYYIENFSLLTDIKLILGTAKVIFKSDATEGFDSSFFDDDSSSKDAGSASKDTGSAAKDAGSASKDTGSAATSSTDSSSTDSSSTTGSTSKLD